MLIKLLSALALATALPLAHADVAMQAIGQQGHRLELHDASSTNCAAPSLKAVMVFPNGKELGGCWVITRQGVMVEFEDGDVVMFPVTIFTKPPKV
jgi:hypothetical protein